MESALLPRKKTIPILLFANKYCAQPRLMKDYICFRLTLLDCFVGEIMSLFRIGFQM
jgi:hypothetical protein